MKKIKLLLIRHGKTKANEKKLYCGKSDICLSEYGKNELLKNRYIYKEYSIDKYFTSGAKRANETIQIIFENNYFEEINEFSEYDFGDFEMKSYDDLKKNKEYINWILDEKGNVICPNGESKNEYKFRIKDAFIKFINKLYKENIESAVLVSHGGTIGIILEMFSNLKGNFYDLQPKCGLGYEVEVFFDNKNINVYVKNKILIKDGEGLACK